MTTKLKLIDNKLLVGTRAKNVYVVEGPTAKMELEVAKQLQEYGKHFVLPWGYQSIDDGETKKQQLIYPQLDRTLMTVLLKYGQTYKPMSVASLVLAEAIHRDIGRALKILEEKKLVHEGLSPLAIFMFDEGMRLGHLQYVVDETTEVEIDEKHAKLVDQDGSLDKITAELRGSVPASELGALLDSNGIQRKSWAVNDPRVLVFESERSSDENDEASEDEEEEAEGDENEEEEAEGDEDEEEEAEGDENEANENEEEGDEEEGDE